MAPLSIIYIDDDHSLPGIGKYFLEQSGEFSVKTCTSLLEATSDILSGNHIDAIVCCCLNPVTDEISLLRNLRRNGITTPFILFTGEKCEDTVIPDVLNCENSFCVLKEGTFEQQFAGLRKAIMCAAGKGTGEACKENSELYQWLSENAPPEIMENLNEVFYVLDVNATVSEKNRFQSVPCTGDPRNNRD